MRILLTFAVLALTFGLPPAARAWGADGHRFINAAAIETLPDSVPAFVRAPEAVAEIRALGPEPDRLKGSGKSFDADFDPGHYLDLDDDGTIAGVVPLAHLPATREAYDTALRSGRVVNGQSPDEYSIGYLPYSIADGWEVIVHDFAIWRVDRYAETHAATETERTAYAADRRLREGLTLRDIGYWGHFVADGSQPLHASVHFNGWGKYPNPNNYTQSNKIHAKFETAFVHAHATEALVVARVGAYAPSSAPIFDRVGTYLLATGSHVPAVYQFEGAGAFDAGTPAAVDFMLDRVADGARMMRNLIADAYAASTDARVGYPAVPVRDIENGTAKASIGALTE